MIKEGKAGAVVVVEICFILHDRRKKMKIDYKQSIGKNRGK